MPLVETKKDSIDTPSLAYDQMSEHWPMLHDLCGGTKAMREAGTKWLPQEPAETYEAYKVRLERSFLFNAYRDTVDRLSSCPFAQPIQVKNCPAELEYLIKNVDQTGKDLNTLAQECMVDLITYGISHLFTDFSFIPQNADPNNPVSKEEERKLGARSTINRVCPVELIGWRRRSETDSTLTDIRIRYTVLVPSGSYLDEEVVRIKHVKESAWTLYEERETKAEGTKGNGKKEFVQINSGPMSLNRIPLSTGYAQQSGFMTADPPLLDLAWLNICHWQSSSDQRNILRFSRFALLFMRGISKSEMDTPVTVGPAQLVRSTSDQADMKYVEHTGKAIEAGAKDIIELEGQMDALGKQPTVKGARVRTATEVANNASKTLTELQAYVRELERLITNAFRHAAAWHRIALPEDFSVQIFDEFDVSVFGDNDLDWILKAWVARLISQKTALEEAMRRGRLSENLDVEDEIRATESMPIDDPLADPIVDDPAGASNPEVKPEPKKPEPKK